MVKCAAVNCRSGYRPTKQEKEMIERGETPPCKKHVFAFPKKAEIRTQWVTAIRRQDTDWNPDNFGVCELHFKPHNLALDLVHRTKTERQRLRLKPDAIPTVFNNYPETARPNVAKERQASLATPSARRAHEAQLLKDQTEELFKEDSITDLDDLFNKLSSEVLPSGFRY